MSHRFASHLTAVFQFPGRPGGVLTNHFIFAVFQFSVGTFQYPGKFPSVPAWQA